VAGGAGQRWRGSTITGRGREGEVQRETQTRVEHYHGEVGLVFQWGRRVVAPAAGGCGKDGRDSDVNRIPCFSQSLVGPTPARTAATADTAADTTHAFSDNHARPSHLFPTTEMLSELRQTCAQPVRASHPNPHSIGTLGNGLGNGPCTRGRLFKSSFPFAPTGCPCVHVGRHRLRIGAALKRATAGSAVTTPPTPSCVDDSVTAKKAGDVEGKWGGSVPARQRPLAYAEDRKQKLEAGVHRRRKEVRT